MKNLILILSVFISINCFSQTAKQVVGYPLGNPVMIHGFLVYVGSPTRFVQGVGTDPDTLYIAPPSGTTTNALTVNNSGSGDASAFNFDGSATKTLSYNSIGAVPTTRTINGSVLSSNVTLSLASSQFANQGTTTTVLHGNASGNTSWGQVGLTTDVTGRLPYANFVAPSTTSLLLGRGTTSGDWQEITLGTNLSMSGTTLNAAGGGGGSSGLTATLAIDSTAPYSITIKNGVIPHNSTAFKTAIMRIDTTAATNVTYQNPPGDLWVGRSFNVTDKYDVLAQWYNPGDAAYYIGQYTTTSLSYQPSVSSISKWLTISGSGGGSITVPFRGTFNNGIIAGTVAANDFGSGGGANGVITIQSQNAPTSGNVSAMNSTTIGASGDITKTTGTFANTVIRSVYNPTSATNNWYDLAVDSREKASTTGTHYLFAAGINPGTIGDFSTFQPKLSVNYSGDVRISTIQTGAATDSQLVVNGGVIKKVLPSSTVQSLTDGATITMDCSLGYNGYFTITGDHTLALSNVTDGKEIYIEITQDGTGNRHLTLPATSKVPNGLGSGTSITLSTGAGITDAIIGRKINGHITWSVLYNIQ